MSTQPHAAPDEPASFGEAKDQATFAEQNKARIKSLISEARQKANRENAQHSCGPKTEAGKAASSQNSLKYGFTARFRVMEWEDQAEYMESVKTHLREHDPRTPTESDLVLKMAQHLWLSHRGKLLQDMCFEPAVPVILAETEKQLALFMRYEAHHERAYHKCLDQLRKMKAERRKTQKETEAQEQRQTEQGRKQEKQDLWVRFAKAKAERQELLNEARRNRSQGSKSQPVASPDTPEKLRDAA